MEILNHLTADGWEQDPVGPDEKLETWAVTVETYGGSRVTRWACVAHFKDLRTEERRELHQRFAPVVAQILAKQPISTGAVVVQEEVVI